MDKRKRPKPTQTFFGTVPFTSGSVDVSAMGVDVVGVAAWVCVLAGVVVVGGAGVAVDEGVSSLVSSKRDDKTCIEASVN